MPRMSVIGAYSFPFGRVNARSDNTGSYLAVLSLRQVLPSEQGSGSALGGVHATENTTGALADAQYNSYAVGDRNVLNFPCLDVLAWVEFFHEIVVSVSEHAAEREVAAIRVAAHADQEREVRPG